MPRSAPSLPLTPSLTPFLPAIYVAWADGELSTTEIAHIADAVATGIPWTKTACHAALEKWLDPQAPPSPTDLIALMMRIRSYTGGLEGGQKHGLASLGQALAKADAGDDAPVAEEVQQALDKVERALGLAGAEASRELFAPHADPLAHVLSEASQRAPKLDVEALAGLFGGRHDPIRQKVREVLATPAYRHEFPLPMDEYRARVLAWLGPIAEAGFGSLPYPYDHDGAPKDQDVGGFLAAFETLAEFDLSLVVKYGVQFGLFGCSILFLGSDQHHRAWLPQIGRLELPGCFAMTELGHGSNVAALETTATYDEATGEFVVHSPTPSSHKWYIGNAAEHGRMATVFAQLVVADEVHGVHALLVPIRDAAGAPMPGVTIGDCGDKMGLDGVDNGWIAFDQVRVGRDALLDRFGAVSEDGSYSSPIASPTRRFFTMLSALVGGRIAVGAAAVTASKVGLTIALRYGERRRQFGPEGAEEWRLMDFQRHRQRLLPRLATAVALDFATKHLVQRYENRTEEDAREVEALAAALKAYQTWFATETIQDCREACGAEGYMARNRITALKADTDVFTTFEGDNTVLMQLVAKTLLTKFGRSLASGGFSGVVRHLATVVLEDAAERNFVTARRTSEDHLRDPEYQRSVLKFRKDDLLRSLGGRIKRRIDEGMDPFAAFAQCQQHALSLSQAYAEHVALEALCEAIDVAQVGLPTRRALELCRDVFALSRMKRDAAWFLENGAWEPTKARAVRKLLDGLLLELRDVAPDIVDAFGIPDHCLAPIAV